MDELLDMNPEVNVQEREYKRLLGYPPDYEIKGLVQDLMDKTRQWYAENGKPWVYIRQAETLELSSGRFFIEGVEFTSTHVHKLLTEAEAYSVMIAVVSAGKGCEERASQLWREEKPDEYFFMEMYGSAVVENLVTSIGARICAWADQHKLAVLPHYSPGYPHWDVSEQHKLFGLIRRKTSDGLPNEIHVMDSGMLNPKKSLLAVFGITKRLDKVSHLSQLVPCENCSLEGCRYRRVPYKRFIQQLENITDLSDNNTTRQGTDTTLTHNAAYKINIKALQKWSRERLVLKALEDRCVEAQFKYEGTTCSNTGRPLEFIYKVKLGAPEDQYRILEASCAPAPTDTGHTYMCQYVKEGKQLLGTIENEKPMLGQPLNAILDWKYASNPAACYCASASREHKWGIVFQVIHYAMAEVEKSGIK